MAVSASKGLCLVVDVFIADPVHGTQDVVDKRRVGGAEGLSTTAMDTWGTR